eukprot:6611791-Ditylum_brightwellii.AAC.1
MGHPQLPTPLITDNNTAQELTAGTMISKRSNVFDLQMHWLKCCEAQQQFNIKWKCREANKADYHSNHHPPSVPKKEGTSML